MPDVSPTKWHRAHVTWFFETFVLGPHRPGYTPHDERYGFLFNSYYEGAGARHPRPERGLLSRPTADEIGAYRRHVDQAMLAFLADSGGGPTPDVLALIELGLHHEQQHQELLVMDAQHVLSGNPLQPAYGPCPGPAGADGSTGIGSGRAAGGGPAVIEHAGGVVEVGHDGGPGFAFDNEGPRHEVLLRPFALGRRLVTNADWLAFTADGGYRRPELWMSEGWATVNAEGWRAPLYWRTADGAPVTAALDGELPTRIPTSSRSPAWCRSTCGPRCTTSAGSRPTPTPAGPGAGSRWRPSGRRPPRNRATTRPTARGRRRCGRRLVRVGVAVDGQPLLALSPASPRPPGRWASTTASSWSTSRCCGGRAGPPRPATPAAPTATSSPPPPGGASAASGSPTTADVPNLRRYTTSEVVQRRKNGPAPPDQPGRMTARRSPGSTEPTSATARRSTVPAMGAEITDSIFMASITATGWPATT